MGYKWNGTDSPLDDMMYFIHILCQSKQKIARQLDNESRKIADITNKLKTWTTKI